MKYPVHALLIAGLLLGGCAVQRFGASAMLMPPEGTELPIQVRAGLFLLPTHFAGDPEEHWLLLDTGTDRALLDVRLAASLGLKLGSRTAIISATGSEVSAQLLPPLPNLRMGSVIFHNVEAAAMDLQTLRDNTMLPIEGILGCDLFRNCLLEIDVAGRRVSLRPLSMLPDEPPIYFTSRVPVVQASFAGKPIEILIDTGFQSLLALPSEASITWRMRPRRTGELATLDGKAEHGSGRAQGELRLGSLSFMDPWVTLTKGQPKLGLRALRNSLFTLDAAGGRVWIGPRR
ncbi:MAG: aspartyl protease family protein [Planctomycetota bacterium]|jgi:predicted aspartyl protease